LKTPKATPGLPLYEFVTVKFIGISLEGLRLKGSVIITPIFAQTITE
jgi:hypothetical protein